MAFGFLLVTLRAVFIISTYLPVFESTPSSGLVTSLKEDLLLADALRCVGQGRSLFDPVLGKHFPGNSRSAFILFQHTGDNIPLCLSSAAAADMPLGGKLSHSQLCVRTRVCAPVFRCSVSDSYDRLRRVEARVYFCGSCYTFAGLPAIFPRGNPQS